MKGITIEPPKYFININFNELIVEIDLTKLNIIQKMMLRMLGVKITKYDEKLVEKLTKESE